MKNFIKNYQSILAILLLALLIRIPFLNGSFWLDEAAQALESARPFAQQLDIIKDFQPPLLHLILHFAMYLGSSEWWLRTIGALIPGLISIWASYEIGKRLFSKRAASVASLLLATNSFHVFYSQELRPYALPLMWASLSWYLIVLLLQYVKEKKLIDMIKIPFTKSTYIPAEPLLLAMYFSTTTLGLYSSFIYPFLVLAQFVFVLFCMRKLLAKFITSWLLSGIMFLPWIPIFLQQLAVGGSWREMMPGWESVVSLTQTKALPLVLGKFIFGLGDLEFNTFYLLSLIFILLLLINATLWFFRSFSLKEIVKDKSFLLPVIWFVVPLLSAWLVSFFVPVVRPKRLLLILPGLYLGVVYFLQTSDPFSKLDFMKNLIKKGGKKTASNWLLKLYGRVSTWALVIFLFLININSLNNYWTDSKLQREDWRGLHSQIIEKYPSQDSIAVFVFEGPVAPWVWYDAPRGVHEDDYPTFDIGQLNINQVDNLRDKMEVLNSYQNILVFDYLQDLTDADRIFIRELEQFGFQQVELIDQPNIGFVRIFTKPEDLLSMDFIREEL